MQSTTVTGQILLGGEDTALGGSFPQPLVLEIAIVSKERSFYKVGRDLASKTYEQVWGTKSLIDDNDYAVVISCLGKVVGNVNLQVKQSNSYLLHSEEFFAAKHWENHIVLSDDKLAEVSGLCVSADIPQFLSRPVMMALILGLHLLHNSLQIRYLTTIQHEYLIRILQRSLNLPFFCNELATVIPEKVPDDNYWKREKSPKIYYLDGYSLETIKACASLHCYLNMAGYHTSFIAEQPAVSVSYAHFWRDWSSIAES